MSTLSTQIREAVFTRLDEFKQFKVKRRSPVETLQTADLPALGVFLIEEIMTADGDADVGEPRFVCNAIIGISVVDFANSGHVLEGKIDEWVDCIEDRLLTDPTFVRLNTIDGKPLIEGFPELRRSHSYPRDGEAYIMEARLRLSVQYRCYFAPDTPNILQIVAVTAEPFGPEGATFENQFNTGASS